MQFSHAFLLRIIDLCTETFPYDPGNDRSLGVIFVRCVVLKLAVYHEVDPGRKSRVLISCCTVQPGLLIVAFHDLPEHAVDRLRDVPLAPEVAADLQQKPCRVFFCEPPRPAAEQLRLRQSEFIDTLLDIADHEQIVFPGNAFDDLLLQIVAVLVFVDKNIFKLLPELAGRLFAAQNVDRVVQRVIELDNILLRLHGLQFRKVLFQQADIIKGVLCGLLQFLLHLLEAAAIHVLLQCVQHSFARVSDGFEQRRCILIRVILGIAHALRGKTVQHVLEPFDLLLAFTLWTRKGLLCLFDDFIELLQFFLDSAVTQRQTFCVRDFRRSRVKPAGRAKLCLDLPGKETVRAERQKRMLPAEQLCLRVSPLDAVMDAGEGLASFQHTFSERYVVSFDVPVFPDKIPKRLRVFFVTPAEHIVHGFLLHNACLDLVRDAESRFQIDQVEILPDHIVREGMEGPDTRTRQFRKLPCEHRFIGVRFLHFLPQSFLETLLHLRCRGVCKRSNKEPIDIGSFVDEKPLDPLYEHGRLA